MITIVRRIWLTFTMHRISLLLDNLNDMLLFYGKVEPLFFLFTKMISTRNSIKPTDLFVITSCLSSLSIYPLLSVPIQIFDPFFIIISSFRGESDSTSTIFDSKVKNSIEFTQLNYRHCWKSHLIGTLLSNLKNLTLAINTI